jgi:nucleotide-binding universal stress UspA family protein
VGKIPHRCGIFPIFLAISSVWGGLEQLPGPLDVACVSPLSRRDASAIDHDLRTGAGAMIPPRRILAAIDFSDSSWAALAFAARLARHCRAELHVLHAEDPQLAEAASARGADLLSEVHEELHGFVASVDRASTVAQYHVVVGTAVDAVCDIALRERVDLVVIGVRGMSRTATALPGSTTDGVLRNSEVSMCVVPGAWRPPQPGRDDLMGIGPVVVAVDERAPSLTAAGGGARLAKVLGTSLELVHVVQDLPVLHRWEMHARAAIASRLRQVEPEIRAHVHGLGLDTPPSLAIQVGDVVERLTEAAAPQPGRAPMLVMGRRSPGHRDNAPGATALRVLTTAHVPVLIQLHEE